MQRRQYSYRCQGTANQATKAQCHFGRSTRVMELEDFWHIDALECLSCHVAYRLVFTKCLLDSRNSWNDRKLPYEILRAWARWLHMYEGILSRSHKKRCNSKRLASELGCGNDEGMVIRWSNTKPRNANTRKWPYPTRSKQANTRATSQIFASMLPLR